MMNLNRTSPAQSEKKYDIRDKLLVLINHRKKSITDIADDAGVSQSSIQQWIYDGRVPSVINAEKVLNALGYGLGIYKLNK